MQAAWYDKQGPADEVLAVGEMPDPEPGPREVRIRVFVSGVNPGDVKKRRDEFGYGMPYPRVIPHSDGAGIVDRVGDKASEDWLGQRVWCWGAQSYRPFGTAAEYVVVPVEQVLLLPNGISMAQGAGLGIPGITGHQAIRVVSPLSGRTVLVRGGAGAVGQCAAQIAHRDHARVIATVRDAAGEPAARAAGAAEVLQEGKDLADRLREAVPEGVDHIVEPAFGENIEADIALLAPGGSIAAYASGAPVPSIPFWPLAFANIRLFFLGSDDFKSYEKIRAARDLNAALVAGWPGLPIAAELPLAEIAKAHDLVERPARRGRVLVRIADEERAG